MTTNEKSIDFARIREQCPKAFVLYLSYWYETPMDYAQHILELGEKRRDSYIRYAIEHPRDLYDFFDAQGLQVYPLPVSATDWQVNIDENKTTLDSSQHHPTRTEAEKAGFIRAFELLEQRL